MARQLRDAWSGLPTRGEDVPLKMYTSLIALANALAEARYLKVDITREQHSTVYLRVSDDGPTVSDVEDAAEELGWCDWYSDTITLDLVSEVSKNEAELYDVYDCAPDLPDPPDDEDEDDEDDGCERILDCDGQMTLFEEGER